MRDQIVGDIAHFEQRVALADEYQEVAAEMHFLFFAESGDDPAVSRWSEGRTGRIQIADSFSSLVIRALEEVV